MRTKQDFSFLFLRALQQVHLQGIERRTNEIIRRDCQEQR